MSAVAIMRELLMAHAPLTALVPAGRIFAGIAPQGTALPSISIAEVGHRELDTVARNGRCVTVRSRVQVTVSALSYAMQKNVIQAARLGPGVHRGVIAGFTVLAVQPDTVGPDLNDLDDDGIYEQSRDFMVTFVEAS